MILLTSKPDSLEHRYLPNAVAVKCDCGITMLWPKGAGNTVRCPDCKAVEVIEEVGEIASHTDFDPHNKDEAS